MKRSSAGILLYRQCAGAVEVLLVHPGGPFWAKKDAGAWSIPKGEFEEGCDPLEAARREFGEELGSDVSGPAIPLGDVKQKGGKVVAAWGVQGDLDTAGVRSNTFEIEWPPRSGRRQSFPEIDRAEWLTPNEARAKLNPAQHAFLDRLLERLEQDGE
jgi:predicted NUDIX family NTP pyrophosphohydrolase